MTDVMVLALFTGIFFLATGVMWLSLYIFRKSKKNRSVAYIVTGLLVSILLWKGTFLVGIHAMDGFLQGVVQKGEQKLVQQIESAVGEDVKPVGQATQVGGTLKDGNYAYLGDDRVYEVRIQDKEIQDITSGEVVIYRNDTGVSDKERGE